MDSDRIKERIRRNAAEIVRLHSRIHETLKHRTKNPEKRRKWQQACAEFHARYEELAFPGSYCNALERIARGDPEAMEAAICFVELRPYFFRSGYMFKSSLSRCRRAPLTSEQAARLKVVEQRLQEWRQRKLAAKKK
jgi:hypothetical protein